MRSVARKYSDGKKVGEQGFHKTFFFFLETEATFCPLQLDLFVNALAIAFFDRPRLLIQRASFLVRWRPWKSLSFSQKWLLHIAIVPLSKLRYFGRFPLILSSSGTEQTLVSTFFTESCSGNSKFLLIRINNHYRKFPGNNRVHCKIIYKTRNEKYI